MLNYSNPIDLLTIFILLGMMPFFVIMGTSFVKFAIVFSLLRNALGTQQTPPNMALYGLALTMTLYVMFPVIKPVLDSISNYSAYENQSSLQDLFTFVQGSVLPYKNFLFNNSALEQKDFFIALARDLWPDSYEVYATDESLFILLPAFITTELIHAFKIGFLLYLPFLAIDIIVSNLLLALGMMMVSPMVFSLPFKIILFISVDGWGNLIQVLSTSYS